MTERIVVGPALVAEATAIAALQRTVLDAGWETRAVASLVEEPAAICRVARSGPRIVGFALCSLAADECEVFSCVVDPAFRRIGTARLLLQAAFEEAVRRGGRHVYLEVAEDNAPAQALYAGLGFATVGRRSHYYQRSLVEAVDALIMHRVL